MQSASAVGAIVTGHRPHGNEPTFPCCADNVNGV